MSWNGSNYPICLVDWSQFTSKTLMKSKPIYDMFQIYNKNGCYDGCCTGRFQQMMQWVLQQIGCQTAYTGQKDQETLVDKEDSIFCEFTNLEADYCCFWVRLLNFIKFTTIRQKILRQISLSFVIFSLVKFRLVRKYLKGPEVQNIINGLLTVQGEDC